jgi:hypothetical protein
VEGRGGYSVILDSRVEGAGLFSIGEIFFILEILSSSTGPKTIAETLAIKLYHEELQHSTPFCISDRPWRYYGYGGVDLLSATT